MFRIQLQAAILMVGLSTAAQGQVLRVAELNTDQIHSLDRAKTVVILVGGILEEHGPYLPSGSDAFQSERHARDVAEKIVARPGWAALLVPTVPLGQGGANIIGGKHSFPGSFNVRSTTLRAVYMDLADAFGELRFQWIFVVDNHGSPNHNRALDTASDYFRHAFGGRMVHLFGLQVVRGCCEAPLHDLLGEAERKEEGFSVHGGVEETSALLFLRPDLVDPRYPSATAVTGQSFPDLVRLARADGWPGYFGSPRLATAALGARRTALRSSILADLALKVLDGWDPGGETRYADVSLGVVDAAADQDDARRERRQREFLDKKERQEKR